MVDPSVADIWPAVWPGLAFVVATTVALALRAAILVGFRRWPRPGSHVVRGATRGPSLLWCITLGLYAANEVALDATALPARWYTWIEMLLEAVLVLSMTVVLASMAGRAVARVSERAGLSADATRLATMTARVGLLVVGLLVLLSALWGGAMTSWTGMKQERWRIEGAQANLGPDESRPR